MVPYFFLNYSETAIQERPSACPVFPGNPTLSILNLPFEISTALWLVLIVSLLGSLWMFMRKQKLYWVAASVAVVTSQVLVILHWESSKYVTLINGVLLSVLVVVASAWRFRRDTDKYVRALGGADIAESIHVSEASISSLPSSVQRWLRASNVVGRSTANSLKVAQEGRLRTTTKGSWMPFKASQHFRLNPPAFVWQATISAAPLIDIAGRDTYLEGKGHMLIKPLYLFSAADALGKEVDQGTLLRFLAEMAWFPQAAISPYLKWESVDDTSARVNMDYKGVSASGIYSFNRDGLVEAFEARRYGDFGGIYRKENWHIAVTGYKTFNGVRVGNANQVTWKLREGDFTWLEIYLTSIEPAAR